MKTQTKAIVASVVVIALCLSAVSGITYSWFSDSEEQDVNITTAVVDMTVVFGNPSTTSAITEITPVENNNGEYTITGLAAGFVGEFPVTSITNSSTVKTVYRQAVQITISPSSGSGNASLNVYDAKNILINSTSLYDILGLTTTNPKDSINADSYEYGFEWKTLNVGESPDLNGFTISTLGTYGDDEENYVGGAKNFSVKFIYQMYQGDYPTKELSSDGSVELGDSTKVQGTPAKTEGDTDAKTIENVIVDFNSASLSGGELSGKTLTVKSVGSSGGDTTTPNFKVGDDGAIISLELSGSTGATFDKPVYITVEIPGDLTNGGTEVPNVAYISGESTGTEAAQPVMISYNVSGTGESAKTTVVFSTTHFSDFMIFGKYMPVFTATGLSFALALGIDCKLYEDVVVDPTLNEELVLDLNGHKIEGTIDVKSSAKIISSATNHGTISCGDGDSKRSINIDSVSTPIILEIDSIDIVGPTSGSNTRGISIYNSNDVTINLNNCEVSANYYAINVASFNQKCHVSATDCKITGWCAYQTHSSGATASFSNCELIGLNDKPYNAEGWNDFATIVINKDTTDCNVEFNNCTLKATSTTGNVQYITSIRAPSTFSCNNCTFMIGNQTITIEGEQINTESDGEIVISVNDTAIMAINPDLNNVKILINGSNIYPAESI